MYQKDDPVCGICIRTIALRKVSTTTAIALTSRHNFEARLPAKALATFFIENVDCIS
jgi:hypothetical protein